MYSDRRWLDAESVEACEQRLLNKNSIACPDIDQSSLAFTQQLTKKCHLKIRNHLAAIRVKIGTLSRI